MMIVLVDDLSSGSDRADKSLAQPLPYVGPLERLTLELGQRRRWE